MAKKWFLVDKSQINLVWMESLGHKEEVATLFDPFCMSQRKLPEEIRVPCSNTHCLWKNYPLVKKNCSRNCGVFGLFKPRIIVATSVSYNNHGFISWGAAPFSRLIFFTRVPPAEKGFQRDLNAAIFWDRATATVCCWSLYHFQDLIRPP